MLMMRNRLFVIMALAVMGCVCIVQTRANIIDTVKEKVMGVDNDDDNNEHKKDEKKDEELYGGGIGKQVVHTMLDAAMDRLVEEAKERTDSKLGDMAIGMASSTFKKKLHSSITHMGENQEDERRDDEQESRVGQHEDDNNDGEPDDRTDDGEEKSGIGKLFDKLTHRHKRSASDEKQPGRLSRMLSRVKDIIVPGHERAPAVAPSVAPSAVHTKSAEGRAEPSQDSNNDEDDDDEQHQQREHKTKHDERDEAELKYQPTPASRARDNYMTPEPKSAADEEPERNKNNEQEEDEDNDDEDDEGDDEDEKSEKREKRRKRRDDLE